MNIILNTIPRPQSNSFVLMQDLDRELLRETKTVQVWVSKETKTRLRTSLQVGSARLGMNLAIEGFKTHEDSDWNYFSGSKSVHNYFKLLKSQNFDAYKEYVKKCIEVTIKDILKMELDEITINLVEPNFSI